MPTDAEREAARRLLEQRKTPPLDLPNVGFLGRLLTAFADTPQGKQNILDRFGIEGELREPVGLGRGSFGDKAAEGAMDVADFAGDVPAAVMGGLGTAAGFASSGPVGAATLGAANAAMGDFGRQAVGGLLGSGEEPDFKRPALEAFLAAVGSKIPGLPIKAANPLQRHTATSNIQKNVMEPAERFGLTDVLPPASRTQSDFVGRTQARIGAEASPAGEMFQKETRENFRQGQQDAYEQIANRAGVSSRGARPGSDTFVSAAEGAREARGDLIGEMFDEARAAVGNTNFPVVVSQTQDALRRMADRRNTGTLRDFNINSSAQKELSRFYEDVGNIQTFEQMDAFRREVGDLLRNPARMEELEKAGMDLDFRDLYGALKRDLETSLGEGKLAQEFGGQTRGQLGSTRKNPLGVQTSTPNQGSANVSRMQEGVYGERDLPGFPGRESEVARGRIPGRAPTDADARSSTEMLDELSSRVDKAQGLRDEASDRFADLINTERSTIIRMMRDPGQAENIYARLFRPSATVDNIRAFRQHIGAEPTPGGNPITKEGVDAWMELQGQVLRDIREFSEDAVQNRLPGGAVPLDGARMRQRLDSLGGEDILSETFGREVAEDLYRFADFVRESDPHRRSFHTVEENVAPRDIGIFGITIARKGAEWIMDKFLKATGFPHPQSAAAKALTTGLVPEKTQGILRSIGAASMTPIGRVDTGPQSYWQRQDGASR